MASAKDYEVSSDLPQYGPPNMAELLYKMISGIPGQYQQGVENQFKRGQMARTERLQQPFDASTDFSTMLKRYLDLKGAEAVPETLPYAMKLDYLRQQPPSRPSPYDSGDEQPRGTNEPTGGFSSAPSMRGSEQHGQPTQFLKGSPSEATIEAGADQADTVRSLATERGLDVDTPGFADAFRGVGLDRPLSQPQAQGVLRQFQNLRTAGMWGPQQASGGAPPAMAGGVGAGGVDMAPPATQQRFGAPVSPLYAQQIPQAPSGAAGMVPPGLDPRRYAQSLKQAAENTRREAERAGIVGLPTKAAEDRAAAYDKTADAILEQIGKAGEPTGAQKEARDIAVQQAKAASKLGEDVATAKGKRIGEIIEAGGLANRQTVNTLNIMEDAMRHAGSNISTGPGAEQWLKVKQAANNIWPDLFKGVPEAETVVKLNAQLASQAAKAMTARPSQLEFRAFMQNNPGLANSTRGTFALINILRQAKEQELALSRHAMNAKNYDNWTDVEDKFFRDNPLKSPFTGKPLTAEDAAPPVPGAKQAPNGNWYVPNPKRPGSYLKVEE